MSKPTRDKPNASKTGLMNTERFELGWWAYAIVIGSWLVTAALVVWLFHSSFGSNLADTWPAILLVALMFSSPSLVVTWSLLTERTTVFSEDGFGRIIGLRRRDVKWQDVSSVHTDAFGISLGSQFGRCGIALLLYKNPEELARFIAKQAPHLGHATQDVALREK